MAVLLTAQIVFINLFECISYSYQLNKISCEMLMFFLPKPRGYRSVQFNLVTEAVYFRYLHASGLQSLECTSTALQNYMLCHAVTWSSCAHVTIVCILHTEQGCCEADAVCMKMSDKQLHSVCVFRQTY